MKKYFAGTIAVALAIVFSAFRPTEEKKTTTQQYFKYLDYPDDSNVGVASRYQPSSDLGCTTGNHRCAVVAEPNSGNPDIPNLSDPQIQIKEKN